MSFKQTFQTLVIEGILSSLSRMVKKYACILEGDTIYIFQDCLLKKIPFKDNLNQKLLQDIQKCERSMETIPQQ